jgi:hypothetical protein
MIVWAAFIVAVAGLILWTGWPMETQTSLLLGIGLVLWLVGNFAI